jgi:hypothetical protein
MPKGQSEGDEDVVAENIVKRVASSVTTVVMLDPSDVLLNLEDTLNGGSVRHIDGLPIAVRTASCNRRHEDDGSLSGERAEDEGSTLEENERA